MREKLTLEENSETIYRLLSGYSSSLHKFTYLLNSDSPEKDSFLEKLKGSEIHEYIPFVGNKNKDYLRVLGMLNKLKDEKCTCYIVSYFSRKFFDIFKSLHREKDFSYYECDKHISEEDIKEIMKTLDDEKEESITVYIDATVLPNPKLLKQTIRRPPFLENDDDDNDDYN
jgi:hypothetical protein